eukprot:361570-Chlamydomonas_euryale.AAC.11
MPVVTRSARGGAAPPPPPTRYDLDSLEANLSALLPGPHPAVASRRAAVLVPLFECGGEVRVVLTQRSHRLSTHQGEVCLPGGKRDEADADDVATALREAHEELALAPADARVLATLQPVLSKHFLSVTPVVAAVSCERRPPFLSPALSSFLRRRSGELRATSTDGCPLLLNRALSLFTCRCRSQFPQLRGNRCPGLMNICFYLYLGSLPQSLLPPIPSRLCCPVVVITAAQR